MNRQAGFFRVILLIALGLVGLVGTVSVRKFALPEMRGLNEPVEAPVPRVPPGLRRPAAIQIHDTLDVQVAGEPGLSGEFIVDDAGVVQLPMIGAVSVAGLTSSAAAGRLVERLADGYLMEPAVAIDVKDSRHQTVFVLGQVNRPGAVAAEGALSLTQAITLAGGPSVAAGSAVLVVRPREDRAMTPTGADDHLARTLALDLDRDAGELLRDGDTIFIRAYAAFFVLGEVRNQGAYVLQPGMTVARALSTAGGLTGDGSTRGIRISRLTGARRVEMGADESTVLAPSDILRIRRRFFR